MNTVRKLIAGTLTAALSTGAAAIANADKPPHPEWHVTRKADAFETHISAAASAQTGNDELVAGCSNDGIGLGLIIHMHGVPRERDFNHHTILILKGQSSPPVYLTANNYGGGLLVASHADAATQVLASNRVIGIRVKNPAGADHDQWFTFSPMDAETRSVLLGLCSPR
jgi:hypothetical protein